MLGVGKPIVRKSFSQSATNGKSTKKLYTVSISKVRRGSTCGAALFVSSWTGEEVNCLRVSIVCVYGSVFSLQGCHGSVAMVNAEGKVLGLSGYSGHATQCWGAALGSEVNKSGTEPHLLWKLINDYFV